MIQRKDVLETFLIFAGFFLVLALVKEYAWAVRAALACVVLPLVIPPVALLFAKAWRWFGRMLGEVNSRIILTAVFFFVLTPLAWFRRIFNRDMLKMRVVRESYWVKRAKTTEEDIEKAW